MNAQLTIDLNSVSYVKYFYENKRGDVRRVLPRCPTVNGLPLLKDAIALPDGKSADALTVATQRGMLDTWTPVCIYQFRNNHSMRFTGTRAKQMKQSYDKHIYKKS